MGASVPTTNAGAVVVELVVTILFTPLPQPSRTVATVMERNVRREDLRGEFRML
jgi:hypothetical protein